MSNASDNKSDVQQAANTANADKIEKNLQQDNDSKKPKDLAENEKTPFIDEQTRTDKQRAAKKAKGHQNNQQRDILWLINRQ